MATTTPQPLPPLEQAWQALWPSLDDVPGLSLVMLFVADGVAKQALYGRALDLLRAQPMALQRITVAAPEELRGRALSALLGPEPAPAIWLDMDAQPEDAAWNAARIELLSRLNEARAQLRRSGLRVLVLALPAGWTKRAAETAPDLWTIRQPSVLLEGVASEPVSFGLPAVGEESLALEVPAADELASPSQDADLQRWLQAGVAAPEKLSVMDGLRAASAALAQGKTELAGRIVAAVQGMVRPLGVDGYNRRDHFLLLLLQGDVLARQLRWAETMAVRVEGLALAEQLNPPDQPASAQGLSAWCLALSKAAEAATALGQLDEAKRLLRWQVSLLLRLLAEFEPRAVRLRMLGVAHHRLMELALDARDAEAALQAARDAELAYDAAAALPDAEPQAWRWQLVAKGLHADLIQGMQLHDLAESKWRELLALFERARADGRAAANLALGERVAAWQSLARLALDGGRAAEALAHAQEAMAVLAGMPELRAPAWRREEQAKSLRLRAEALESQGQYSEALRAWLDISELARQRLADAAGGEAAGAQGNLAEDLLNVARVRLMLGATDEAIEAARQAEGLQAELVASRPDDLEEMAYLLRVRLQLAEGLNASGNQDELGPLLVKVYEGLQQLHGQDAVAEALLPVRKELAGLVAGRGDHGQALALLDANLQESERLWGADDALAAGAAQERAWLLLMAAGNHAKLGQWREVQGISERLRILLESQTDRFGEGLVLLELRAGLAQLQAQVALVNEGAAVARAKFEEALSLLQRLRQAAPELPGLAEQETELLTRLQDDGASYRSDVPR